VKEWKLGKKADGGGFVVLRGNVIEDNGGVGAFIDGFPTVIADGNRIARNHGGGLVVISRKPLSEEDIEAIRRRILELDPGSASISSEQISEIVNAAKSGNGASFAQELRSALSVGADAAQIASLLMPFLAAFF
jgi:hypothetical protein